MTLIDTSPHKTTLMERVFRLLQEAGELGGLDLDEYVRLMEEIAVECHELAEATATTLPRKLEACEGGVKVFEEAFPEGFDASFQLGVLRHPELRRHLGWAWGKKLLPRLPMAGWNLRGANLSGADLRWANLIGADLSGAGLYEANLRGADLRKADLRGANLREADLRGAELRGADLRGANLHGADLREANLYKADLYKADLRGAYLYGAQLLGANLSEADLSGARWSFRERPTGLNVNEAGKRER